VYSKLKILGHPVHPMLVSYPIALYTATLVSYLIFAIKIKSGGGVEYTWVDIAIAANIGGVIMAVPAAFAGFVDWFFGIPNGTDAKRHGTIHMALNIAALIFFVANAIVHHDKWGFYNENPHSGVGIVLAALGVACTVGAGLFGWMMVQDDHVGVNLLPEQETFEPKQA
jgi:uncharacterized membrane protein